MLVDKQQEMCADAKGVDSQGLSTSVDMTAEADNGVEMVRRLRRRVKKEKYQPVMQKLAAIEDERRPEEEKHVEALRMILKKSAMLPPEHDDYHTLLRFLKFCKFNLQKTEEKWAKYLQWRKEYNTDDVLRFDFPEMDEVNRVFTGKHHGMDRQGRPVFWGLTGRNLVSELLEVTTKERFIRYKVMDSQRSASVRLPACSVVTGKTVTGVIIVMDAWSLGWKNVSSDAWHVLKECGKIDTDNFPGLCQGIIIINANTFLRYIWSTLSFFLDASTLEKVHVYGPDYKEELFKFIDPSQVPAILGGECSCGGDGPLGCLVKDVGVWNDPEVLKVVHLMRRGALRVKDPTDIRRLVNQGRIRWDAGQFKLDGEPVADDEDNTGSSGITTPAVSEDDQIALGSASTSTTSPSTDSSFSSPMDSSPPPPTSMSLRRLTSFVLPPPAVGKRPADPATAGHISSYFSSIGSFLLTFLTGIFALLRAPFLLVNAAMRAATESEEGQATTAAYLKDIERKLEQIEEKVVSLAAVAAQPSSLPGSEPPQPSPLPRSITADAALDEKRVERMEAELKDTKRMLEDMAAKQERLLSAVHNLEKKNGHHRHHFVRRISSVKN